MVCNRDAFVDDKLYLQNGTAGFSVFLGSSIMTLLVAPEDFLELFKPSSH